MTYPRYRYEPKHDSSGKKIKHKWNQPEPGFKKDASGHPESMCPDNISLKKAEELLNSGLHDSPPNWPKSHPKHIYAIYNGAVYKAVETIPGESYHGFPCPGPRTYPRKPDMTKRMKK